MKPYKNAIKLTECPDILDIITEGRRARIGRIAKGEFFAYEGKVIRNERGYLRKTSKKAAIRRYLKRKAKGIQINFECLS